MTHDFVVNTENVNEYKFRVLTSGIDYKQYLRNPVVLYIHTRENKDDESRGSEVVGRCIALIVKGTELIATIEFDEEDPFAKKIAGKVQRGYLRMSSIYADVIETSMDPELILEGQLYATVTKSKLVEISIVPIGGNDDALKLSKYGFDPVKLNKVNSNKNENMSHLKTIALALSLSHDADESSLLNEIKKIKLDKETSDNKVAKLEKQISDAAKEEGTQLIEKVIELGLLPDGLKAVQLSAYEKDPAGQKVILSKLIADKEAQNTQSGDHSKIKEVVLNAKNGTGVVGDSKESFDYLQKHDPVKLGKIRDEDAAKYTQLAKDYAAGVRHPEAK
ncbi:HK97 family phage prohead protease [Flavobacterium sp. AC]|uniref:HK97 family phage prohead protease n=1 Tax=Flavobacterium azizsancarii TaxID=2961580 RepID=A0ABT4W7Y4_9FLAO|nr:HK97 family phage prohead protease [Flavobacterium azizsancarii]MDA6068647.1 HK97 family phage prohead protease [Flavobacterium azizsancarii]